MKAMKKEIIILGVVIVLLLGYLLFKSSDKVHYKIPGLETVKTEDIDKIEIIKEDATIQLAKQDDKWVIAPQGFPTDSAKIEKVTGTISGLTLTELVSKSRSYTRYDLTKEKAIHVKAYNKDNVLRDFEIGKTGATYGHTFVKIAGDSNVYYARESFRSHFDVKTGDLRDKKVLTLDSNEISEITIRQEGKTVVFSKQVKSVEPPKPEVKEGETPPPPQQPQEEISWVKDDGTKGEKSKVDSLINQLTNLSCQDYIEDKTKEDFAALTPLYTLKLKGSKDFVITIFPKPEKKEGDDETSGDDKHPVLSSESPYPFLLNSWKADQIMKKPGDLLPEKKEEK